MGSNHGVYRKEITLKVSIDGHDCRPMMNGDDAAEIDDLGLIMDVERSWTTMVKWSMRVRLCSFGQN